MLRSIGFPIFLCLTPALPCALLHAGEPLIVSQSGDMRVRDGESFAAKVVALGEGLGYQWFRDREEIAGETGEVLLIGSVSTADAGGYHVEVANAHGMVAGDPVMLTVDPPPDPGVAAGSRGIVNVPGHLAYYDLYLPSNYHGRRVFPPILFTFSPGGGGMVGHFQNVAAEKGWIVVGVSQSRNQQGGPTKRLFSRAVVRHVLENVKFDPNRVFVAGMSGGGQSSFNAAKIDAPLVAGVFSMGGWLGRQFELERDIYLPGILVARANGDNDQGANNWLGTDRSYLRNFTANKNIRDWSFPGGHVPSPEWVQREVFDWLLEHTPASNIPQRREANEQAALWKARISAGEATAVYEELVQEAFGGPRSPMAVAAWRTMDYLFTRDDLFLRGNPPDFADFYLREYVAVHLHHALFAFIHERDPSRQFSAVAAARAMGEVFETVQMSVFDEAENIMRHPPRTAFDAFVLENELYERPEPPLTGDWDGDGRDNLSEFVLGTSPLAADPPPRADIRILGGEAYVVMPGCRGDRAHRLAAMATSNPAWGWWVEAPVVEGWWRAAPDGSRTLVKRLGNVEMQPRMFARFGVSTDPELWLDPNGDGIPVDYRFPLWRHTGQPGDADSPDLPDARQLTDVPGGPPMYLRYLTAAEIGPVQGRGGSLRYHPLLAGYRGYLYHEVWMDVPGSTIASAAGAVASRPPNDVRLITSTEAPWFNVEGPTVMGDNYFERSRGYIVPDITGNHVFSIAGDDQSELWLSTDEDPANAVRIAHVQNWTAYRNFTQNASQTSTPVPLVAGNRYYVEILHKEGTGADHCTVAWITPGSSERVIIPSANLACLPLELIEGPGP